MNGSVCERKRGPKPLPPERKLSVVVGIRVPADLADWLFVFSGRNRKTASDLTRNYWERLRARERELLLNQISK